MHTIGYQSHAAFTAPFEGDFHASRPNENWLSDITDLPTQGGWLYLADIQDACSRRLVGWSMGDRPTPALVCDAWHLAVGQRGTPPLPHSDQGSQSTSEDDLSLLEATGVPISMRAVGRCCGNVRWVMKENLKKQRLTRMDAAWVQAMQDRLNV
ncbi:MAG: DDE-type integrase/transposase/recombinase [Anaerolineae bacterium]|nr:DDE-type integrase/transposase/recombinase [Anaerolineae bacterium]